MHISEKMENMNLEIVKYNILNSKKGNAHYRKWLNGLRDRIDELVNERTVFSKLKKAKKTTVFSKLKSYGRST